MPKSVGEPTDWGESMTNLDKVVEYLHYHPGANRRELIGVPELGIKDNQMKALLGNCIASGDVRDAIDFCQV